MVHLKRSDLCIPVSGRWKGGMNIDILCCYCIVDFYLVYVSLFFYFILLPVKTYVHQSFSALTLLVG